MARILVVDDDTSVRVAIQTLLEHEGFDVTIADNGRSGLAALERTTFDLVIVDIFMPGMDGLETIKAFHHRAPNAESDALRTGFRRKPDSVPMIAVSL